LTAWKVVGQFEFTSLRQRLHSFRGFLKSAGFSAVESLDSFEVAAVPSLNQTLVLELARSEYVARRKNIIGSATRNRQTHVAL
jgi:hypothetical protein